ncbi:DUF4365 domain-containing protein [Mycolicibacterium pallens]|uniref:DUF4365 domain-containing protein n=1 Tax=Mycolicibacterium pallens TaxID=370524 RepID=A0ABX8VT08_9MYCO|nr:DUF4365 domain-containing protein [Mycolicibacterium pallens]QYL18679.1 hypothetical protein K0O64_09390 [Mycolicibacterium pallens]
MEAESDSEDRLALGGRAPGHLGLGAAGELLFASRIALFGYQVYRPLADDRGVDLVVDVGDGQHAMVQVKSVHSGSYVFMRKSTFALKPWVAVGVVVFDKDHEIWPSLYLIPATAWLEPVSPLVDHEYEGKKSAPEFGLSIRKNWKQDLDQWNATEAHIEAVLEAARRR